MKTKYTPGPWRVSAKDPACVEYFDEGPEKYYEIARAFSDGTGLKSAEANARLISAAPELLAAVKSLLVAINASGHATSVIPESRSLEIHELIAKAEGVTNE